MKRYTLLDDIKVFGIQVPTFPEGIGEAFDLLSKALQSDEQRTFYGITESTENGVIYRAMALETFEGEADRYGYETYTIPRGDYLIESVKDWTGKTDSIKYVFQDMFTTDHTPKHGPCVEWYKSKEEMLCMVKIDD